MTVVRVRANIRAPDMDKLGLYCDRVASAVGRLSVRVFGRPETGDYLKPFVVAYA